MWQFYAKSYSKIKSLLNFILFNIKKIVISIFVMNNLDKNIVKRIIIESTTNRIQEKINNF